MAHDHHHQHDHGHSHSHAVTQVNKAFYIGISLNALFVVVEVIAGFYSGSLALLTDAGHNLGDVASLALSLLAFRLAKAKATPNYTYGFRKSTVLVTLLNAVILLVGVGSIGYEAILRIGHTPILPGKLIALVAGLGIVINAISAFLFFKDREKDLNIKGAYLHLAADAVISLGVVIAGLVIAYTNWAWVDSVISFIIIAVILFSTWQLLLHSIRLSLDGVPGNVNVDGIQAAALKVAGVVSIHHLHVWALSTTENACTLHLVVKPNISFEQLAGIKHELKHALAHLNINHATVEAEIEDESCKSKAC